MVLNRPIDPASLGLPGLAPEARVIVVASRVAATRHTLVSPA